MLNFLTSLIFGLLELLREATVALVTFTCLLAVGSVALFAAGKASSENDVEDYLAARTACFSDLASLQSDGRPLDAARVRDFSYEKELDGDTSCAMLSTLVYLVFVSDAFDTLAIAFDRALQSSDMRAFAQIIQRDRFLEAFGLGLGDLEALEVQLEDKPHRHYLLAEAATTLCDLSGTWSTIAFVPGSQFGPESAIKASCGYAIRQAWRDEDPEGIAQHLVVSAFGSALDRGPLRYEALLTAGFAFHDAGLDREAAAALMAANVLYTPETLRDDSPYTAVEIQDLTADAAAASSVLQGYDQNTTLAALDARSAILSRQDSAVFPADSSCFEPASPFAYHLCLFNRLRSF